MSNGTLDRQRFEAIEAYLLGTMPPEERERFDAQLISDPALRSEVETTRDHILAVELGGLTRTLRTVAQQDQSSERTSGSSFREWWRYAAALAILVAVAAWFLVDQQPAHDRLFAEHYVTDPGLPVPMSSTDDAAFQDAMVAFKLGEYGEARTKWMPLLNADPANDTLRYYVASAALSEGDLQAAIPLLEQVAATPTSVFKAKARWYLFLAHLQGNDVAAMEALDLKDDPMYGQRVRAIMDELGR